LGLNDFDADLVNIALSELGLSKLTVADFSGAVSIDSAVYAVKKSLSSPLDHQIGKQSFVFHLNPDLSSIKTFHSYLYTLLNQLPTV
jgi:hypothetical protein